MSLLFRKSDAVLCANPLITKYNMEPPETPKVRIHNGYLQIELLRGEGGRSIWRDAPGQVIETIDDHLPNEK